MGGIIIGKSFDKLVKARDVKVSTKRWRDGSQTQRYGGSGTGYQATNSIRCPRAEGPSIYHIYWIAQGLYLTYNCVPQYIWGYFREMCNKSHWILQRFYRSKVCYRRTFALSRRCWVSRTRPRVLREAITVISLWRHNGVLWNNGESIAAHNNAIPRTMDCITI